MNCQELKPQTSQTGRNKSDDCVTSFFKIYTFSLKSESDFWKLDHLKCTLIINVVLEFNQ